MNHGNQPLNRRAFLKHAGAATVVGAVAVTTALGRRWAARRHTAAAPANPFAYETPDLTRTDPGLVHYETVAQFRAPRPDARRLTVGPDARLYLAAGNYLSVLDSTGAVLHEIALTGAARCVAVAPEGAVYVGLRDHLEVFDPTGRRQGVWESPGARAWFTGLAVGPNDLFAADAGNRVVLRYDRSGKLLRRFGERSADNPGFVLPSPYLDVELGADGLLQINNPGRHQVEAYSASGEFQFAWGKASAAIEGFCGCCNPVGLALLADGRIVTCEKGLPRVKVYNAQGKLESVVAGPEVFPENTRASADLGDGDGTVGALDVAVDERGRVYVLDPVAGDVRVFARKRPAPAGTG